MATTYKSETIFQVVAQSHFSLFDLKVLVRLYQPIIGHEAVTLYLTLWSDYLGEFRVDTQIDLTFQRLLDQLQMSLPNLNRARMSLEAHGLMDTYESKGVQTKLRFVLFNPLLPEHFFRNDLLNVLLLKTLGPTEYQRTKTFFVRPSVILPDEQKISVSIDVFHDTPTQLSPEEQSHMTDGMDFFGVQTHAPESTFNFAQLRELMKDHQLSERLLTAELRSKISAQSMLNQLSTYEIVRAMARSVTGTGLQMKLNMTDFEKACQVESRQKQATRPLKEAEPVISYPPTNDSPSAAKLAMMKSKTPVEFLSIKFGNRNVLDVDQRMIMDVQRQTGLNNAVMNVVIDFVTIRHQGALPRSYFEKIASTLMRNNITDPEVAMVTLDNFGKGRAATPSNAPDVVSEPMKSPTADVPSDAAIAELLAKRAKKLKGGS